MLQSVTVVMDVHTLSRDSVPQPSSLLINANASKILGTYRESPPFPALPSQHSSTSSGLINSLPATIPFLKPPQQSHNTCRALQGHSIEPVSSKVSAFRGQPLHACPTVDKRLHCTHRSPASGRTFRLSLPPCYRATHIAVPGCRKRGPRGQARGCQ